MGSRQWLFELNAFLGLHAMAILQYFKVHLLRSVYGIQVTHATTLKLKMYFSPFLPLNSS